MYFSLDVRKSNICGTLPAFAPFRFDKSRVQTKMIMKQWWNDTDGETLKCPETYLSQFPPQISRGWPGIKPGDSAVRGGRLTAWAKVRPYILCVSNLLSAASHFLKEHCFWDGSQVAPVCPSPRTECKKKGHCSVPCTSTKVTLVCSPFDHAFCPSGMNNKPMKTSMDRGETSMRRKTCPSVNLYTVYLTHSCLGSHPDLRRERPAANCLLLARPLKAKTKQKERNMWRQKEEGKKKHHFYRFIRLRPLVLLVAALR